MDEVNCSGVRGACGALRSDRTNKEPVEIPTLMYIMRFVGNLFRISVSP